ncbi:MAG: hypothetical protein ABSF71_31135 [Terriglobia bacterium]|jgi:hypothetical protein
MRSMELRRRTEAFLSRADKRWQSRKPTDPTEREPALSLRGEQQE